MHEREEDLDEALADHDHAIELNGGLTQEAISK
jgi:hypothetical protein